MIFKDSCVKKITPFSLHEESTAINDCIFPAYVGTSKIILGIDASGLQNLSNNRLQRAYGSVEATGDTYVVTHGRMGDHLSERNALPFGYFTWKIKYDNGLEIDPSTQKDELSCWSRDLFIDEGRVSTNMVVNYFSNITFEVIAPIYTNCILICLKHKPFDYKILNYVPEKEPKSATVEIALNMVSRQGKKLYDSVQLNGDIIELKVNGYETYENKIRLTGTNNAEVKLEGDCFKIIYNLPMDSSDELKILYDFEGEKSVKEYNSLIEENIIYRKQFFDKIAKIEGINVKETFLYNNSHYLCMSGFDYTKGLPIGLPYMLPKWWRCSTFWDSHFVMDGLMRSGVKKEADEFVVYLHKSMNKTGKPFPWMFAYDAKPTVDASLDNAPIVMCAHAMTAIKHYMYFQDEDMLRKHILPIVERVSQFASTVLFSKEEDGKYILSIPVTGDVVEDSPKVVNATVTAVWFLSVFKLCLELQKISNKEECFLLKDIVENYKLEKNDKIYLDFRGHNPEESGSWVSILMYPTEGLPFLDKELFDKTCEKYSFAESYMKYQACYQPWTEFKQANSDFRRGAIEDAYRMRLTGLEHCFGTGLFCEIGAKQQIVGIAPYISAHGTYLTSFLYQFVSTNIWTGEIGVFDCLPKAYEDCEISVCNVVCSGGKSVTASLNKYLLSVSVKGSKNKQEKIKLKIPKGLYVDKMRVFHNGRKTEYKIINDCVEIEYISTVENKFEIK